MVIVLLYRVTFQASYNGSHFELGITTYVSMRKMIPEPTNQTKVSLVSGNGISEFLVHLVGLSSEKVQDSKMRGRS